jgi:hypothetical protein
MAISRYDQRKNYKEAEANAIGTEYLRADLLPGDDSACASQEISRPADLVLLQDELWSALRTTAAAQPTPVVALAISGMNDVLNSSGYTPAAWALMGLIAICCNVLVGYGARRAGQPDACSTACGVHLVLSHSGH